MYVFTPYDDPLAGVLSFEEELVSSDEVLPGVLVSPSGSEPEGTDVEDESGISGDVPLEVLVSASDPEDEPELSEELLEELVSVLDSELDVEDELEISEEVLLDVLDSELDDEDVEEELEFSEELLLNVLDSEFDDEDVEDELELSGELLLTVLAVLDIELEELTTLEAEELGTRVELEGVLEDEELSSGSLSTEELFSELCGGTSDGTPSDILPGSSDPETYVSFASMISPP